MGPFQHILVPVDFGDATAPAIDLTLMLARAFDAKVTLVHAFDPTPFATSSTFLPAFDMEPVLASLEQAMTSLREKTRAAWPRTEGVVCRGDVYQSILEVAKLRDCDLIVIGTHGRRGAAHFLLGSVAEKIVRVSPIPVLTVRPTASAKAATKG